MARRGDRRRPRRQEEADVKSSRGTPAPGRRRAVTISIAIAAAVIALGIITQRNFQPAGDAVLQPLVPNLTTQSPAVRQHLQNRYESAVQAPRSAEALGPFCVALHADMFYEHADACYARVSELEPMNWRWMYLRGLIRADRGGGDALIEALRRTVAVAPDFSPAWLRLGDAHFKARRYDDAAAAWNRASQLPDPDRSESTPPHITETPVAAYAQLGLARVALLRDDARGAEEILRNITERAPRFSAAHRLLADALQARGRSEDAARALNGARRLPPFSPYADPVVDDLARESRNSTFLLRMASEADLGINGSWSEHLTRRALEFDPDNPEVVSKLGRVLRQLGRSAEALPYFERYHAMVPGDFQGIAHLGSCLSDLGRYGDAEPLLRRAAAGLDDALSHYNLGLLLARTDRPEEAIREYRRSLERDPNHADARINLATVLARQGDLAGAARELNAVVARDPSNALAHVNLGVVLDEQGQRERAIRAFETALQLEPSLTAAAEALRSMQTTR